MRNNRSILAPVAQAKLIRVVSSSPGVQIRLVASLLELLQRILFLAG